MIHPGRRSIRDLIPSREDVRSSVQAWLDTVQQNSPLAFALDYVIGGERPEYQAEQWLEEEDIKGADAAPIIKLASAILQQATSDRASRIELRTGLPEVDYPGCPTLESFQYELKQQAERERFKAILDGRIKPDSDFELFLATVKAGRREPISSEGQCSVLFHYGNFPTEAMRIPGTLTDILVRRYQYYFNYNGSASIARPENLLYIETKTQAAFASIDHYDRQSEYKVGIVLTPEPKP